MNAMFPALIVPGTTNNMTGVAVVTSLVMDMRTIYACAIQAKWTGTAVGTFSIQGSLDYKPNQAGGTPLNSGTWDDMGITPANLPAGSANHTLIDIGATGIPFIRIVYTNSSGTGTLTVYGNSKG